MHKMTENLENSKKIGYCNICNNNVESWGYCGNDIKTKYAIIGNGKRVGLCPHCQSYDRGRWFYFVLKNFTSLFENGGEVLHFAPEKQIESQLRKMQNISYYTVDIMEGVADYTVDMTNIPFEDNKFDYIIANHVLEHIEDEKAALLELKRCIRKNGKIILSFPVTMDVNTFELADMEREEDRIYYYGQNDHVRLYGKDFKERLELLYEVRVEAYCPQEILQPEMIEKLRVIRNDNLIICSALHE